MPIPYDWNSKFFVMLYFKYVNILHLAGHVKSKKSLYPLLANKNVKLCADR